MYVARLNATQTSFQGAQKYKAIRHLPNMTCACCGEKVINGDAMQRAYASVTKPLSSIIKKGFFKVWEKHTGVWAVLMDLSQKFPKKSLDKIVLEDADSFMALKQAVAENVIAMDTEKGIDNPYGQSIKINDLYYDILKRSRANLMGASTVMKRFSAFKHCLKGTRLETFEQLQIYAKKYPRKTLSEIIRMDEIYKFHCAKDVLQRAQTREKMDYHFSNILDLIKKSAPEAVEFFAEVKEKAVDIIASEKDSAAKIPLIKSLYSEALQEKGCEKLKEKVFSEVEKLPTTFITTDSFLVYAVNHDYTDSAIVASLLRPSQSSFEHIIPRSAKGKDSPNNGLVMCVECNSSRSSREYKEFLQYHPKMPYNTQKQIDYISRLILEDRIDGDDMRLWPIRVAKTLREYTGGLIDIDLRQYSKKALKKSQKNQEIRAEKLRLAKQQRDIKIKEKLDLERQLRQLKDELNEVSSEVDSLKNENAIETYIQNHFKQQL